MGGLKPGTGSALAYRGWLDEGADAGSGAVATRGGMAARATVWQIWHTVQLAQSSAACLSSCPPSAGANACPGQSSMPACGSAPACWLMAGDGATKPKAMASPTQPRKGSKAIMKASNRTRMH